MKVDEFLDRDNLIGDLKAQDKEGILREMVDLLVNRDMVSSGPKAVDVLLEREKLGSTGIGDGIAIPHGKLPELEKVIAVFGRSRGGVSFDSMDGEPVHLFFLLLAPENSASLHLKALARISRLLKAEQFRQELITCESAGELYDKICAEDDKH